MPSAASENLINLDSLRPYISLLFLQCTSDDESFAFDKLTSFTKNAKRSRENREYTILQSGFTDIPALLKARAKPQEIDQIDGFTYKVESNPSWATQGSPFLDVQHSLCIVMRRGKIFAIHCEPSMREQVEKWLRSEPRPPFNKISQSILQGAFLRGEAKGLWLRGTHVKSAIRPDTKHITGIRIQDALNPLEDSSFAMAAARSSLPEDASRTSLAGNVGTAPRKGTLWNKKSQDFDEFATATVEAIKLVEAVISDGTPLDRPFPILAVSSNDLSDVSGAYDILTLTPDDLPTSTDVTDEMHAAAEVLEQAVLRVNGSPTSADFKLEVGLDGSTDGVLQATVRMDGDDVAFSFGYDLDTAPTNPEPVRRILDALKNEDLFAVYYDSGHVVGAHGIGRRNIRPTPFENWTFSDFSGFDLAREKPGDSPIEIHAKTGEPDDTSLFGWVVKHYSSGWLICDDGPGEVADFVHISYEGTLSLIHVKAAQGGGRRRISTSAYEVVASQAAKNGRYLTDLESMRDILMLPNSEGRAAWIDGVRVSDRTEFLEFLEMIEPRNRREVVIVQPHVSEKAYKRAWDDSDDSPARKTELLRLNSLETLLHTIRGSIVALGADLRVISSKF